jgi:hypothetical protein
MEEMLLFGCFIFRSRVICITHVPVVVNVRVVNIYDN